MGESTKFLFIPAHGFPANRKTVKDDILTVAGYDIVVERGGNNNAFYFGMRDFDLPEIKLLIDAVSSCKHIGVEQSKELIEKRTKLERSHRGENRKIPTS